MEKETEAAEARVKGVGIELSEDSDEARLRQVNDLYTKGSKAVNIPAFQKSKVDLHVSFENMPKGTRVSKETSGTPVVMGLDLGYASAGTTGQ